MNWLKRFFSRLLNFIWHLEDVYHELKPCRFAFIVAIIGLVVLRYVEQGTEVLRALAERGALTGATGKWRVLMFATGLLLWSLSSWYSARVLLSFDFPKSQPWRPPRRGFWRWLHIWLRRNVPRFLGVAPMLIVGWSFLSARHTYEDQPPRSLLYFGLLSIAGAVALYLFFITRRRWMERSEGSEESDPKDSGGDSAGKQYHCLNELEWESLIVLGGMALVSIILLILFTVDPVSFAGRIGTGAVLMFAAGSWVVWGSALVYFGSWYRLPVVTFLLVWIAFCSFFNDNHNVRLVPPGQPFPRPTLKEALVDWNTKITAKYPAARFHPLFIVAAEGGGIRAAYWTATVLGSLQDAQPSFADHVFAISGVSGGSLGATVFNALLADATPERTFLSARPGLPGPEKNPFTTRAQMILGQDFLSPAAAAMLYPDSWQRLLPFPISALDRGRSLERGWEKAWKDVMGTNRFAGPFSALWNNRGATLVPALFLNGTAVETGNRIITSNIQVLRPGFLEAVDLSEKLPEVNIPVSTAAHMSARFTYVSPAGRLPGDGTHIVDGGYFENSGAATALDILRQLNRILHEPENHLGAIFPQIIMISNAPLGVASGTRQMPVKEAAKGTSATTSDEVKSREPGAFLEDALAPVYALLSAREARGEYAQQAIGRAQDEFCAETAASLMTGEKPGCKYFFSLTPATVPLPLGWMLSNGAAEAMQKEMYDLGWSKKEVVHTWNKAMLEQIVSSLPAQAR